MQALDIRLVPLLKDNYGYLLHDADSGKTAVVDPSEAPPVLDALTAYGWELDVILNTHHHPDHTGGNLAIKAETGAAIIAPAADAARIPGMDRGVKEKDTVMVGGHRAKIIEIHGHTNGHIAFWFEEDEAVFCGDTLFALGCGRMFEGTPAEMWDSLQKLRALPPETRVYCGHEYTAANCRFALTIEPGNAELRERAKDIARLRESNQPTIPSTIGEECLTNPFLRADLPELQHAMGVRHDDAVAAFAEIRHRKDQF